VDGDATAHALDFPPQYIDAAAMRRLILLRHAKSDWSSPGMPDVTRALNERGAEAARLMGGYIVRHGLAPDLVLCSPAKRTRETLAAMVPHWPSGIEVGFEERLYAATPQTILSVICALEADTRTVMLIGHNPGLHEAAELLIAAGDVGLRERLREKFPTAALAVIDFAVDAWSRIHHHSGRLDRCVTPRSVAAATN
jgi:phosphohistidine phosphatase